MHNRFRRSRAACWTSPRLALFFALLSIAPVCLSAQDLRVYLSSVDFRGLPVAKLKVCTESGGVLLRGLDSSNIRLADNGVERRLTVRCPDPAQINSVALVLDNSGSMQGVMPKLIEAAGRLVDSLGPADECAIITFGRVTAVRQDFTSDKAQLKSVLSTLVAEGGTAIYDASLLGVDTLSARPGNRHAVIITDGEDNQSISSPDDVIARAVLNRVKVHAIAFGISEDYAKTMRRFATSTGGLFFSVVRPSELANVYERIAAEITERCCVIEYTTDCSDSLHVIDVRVTVNGDTAWASETFRTASRPQKEVLAISVPSTLRPLESGLATVTLTPPPAPDLALTLRFTVEYDEKLVEINPVLPFTLGTVAENQLVNMQKIGPGRMLFTLSDIVPASATNLIVGFPVQGQGTDSSRAVEFRIVDAVLEGCPVEVETRPDTVEVCQCLRAFSTVFPPAQIVTIDGRIEIPVLVPPGMLDAQVRAILSVDIGLPVDASLLGIIPGDVLPADGFSWSLPDARTVRIASEGAVLPLRSAGELARILLLIPQEQHTKRRQVTPIRARLWQQCCPADTAYDAADVFVEGVCEKYLRYRSDAPTVRIAPHPVASRAPHATAFVFIPNALMGTVWDLNIVDLRGRSVTSRSLGQLSSGETRVPIELSALQPGQYMAVLSGGTTIAVRAFVVLP